MSLSFHQVIRDKRTGKTKGFLEEVDSQGDHPAENSFQTRNSCNNRSFMVEKENMVDDFDDYWNYCWMKLWMILAIQFNLRSGCSGSPLTG